ncbi:MAG: S9 family peptidase [Bacilli bacterium]|nr:S9 family peptidase [Bacilli bacterium]
MKIKEKILIDDFKKIISLANPTFSENGENIAFTKIECNMDENRYDSYLYLKKKNEQVIKLTSIGKEHLFKFYDDNNIIFASNREFNKTKKENGTIIYKININGGEAEEFIKLKHNIDFNSMEFINDKLIYSASNDPKHIDYDLLPDDNEDKKKWKQEVEDNQDYEIIDSYPWWINGAGFTRGMINSLYIKDGDAIKRLTDDKFNCQGFEVLKEYNKRHNTNLVIVYGDYEEGPLTNIFENNIYLFDLDDKSSDNSENIKLNEIINKKDLRAFVFCEYNDKLYLFGDKKETGLNTDPDIYSYNINTKEIKKECNFGYSIYSSVGTDVRLGGGRNGKLIDNIFYFLSTDYDKGIIYRYLIDKQKIEKMVIDNEYLTFSFESFDIYKDKIIAISFNEMKPQELYFGNIKGKRFTFNDNTEFNKEFCDNKKIIKTEKFEYSGKKYELPGYVIKPYNYDESCDKLYPVLLEIHGGPKTVYGEVFYHEMQYFASLGYFVIFTNPTGGDGRGRKFADIRGKYGLIDYEDIMLFVDEALKRYPKMDKNNLFETGGSYGGFMTNWIIGHTDRFKACVSQRSISNWISFYGVSDIGVGFAVDQTKGDIWADLNKMWFHSPLKYADKVKTPTLFIHSNEDYRCPIEQGLEMYTSLISHNVKSKLIYFKGENHDLSRTGKPKHRLKRLEEIKNWFEQYRK